MQKIHLIIFFFFVTNAKAWDFSYKLNAQHSQTNNVNLTDTNPIADTSTNYLLTLQTKNDDWKFRFKTQMENYQKQTENDYYSGDLSATYNKTKDNDYTLSFFKLVYNHTPAISSDSASDNYGVKVATNFYHEIDSELTSFISLSGSLKNYDKIIDRKDDIVFASVGLESYLTSIFMISPEFNLSLNHSTQTTYNNMGYGPAVTATLSPNEDWELSFNASYTYTLYSDRKIDAINGLGKRVSTKEHQGLMVLETGTTYYITKHLPLTLLYSKSANTSNNTTYQYNAENLSFGLGFKF